MEVRIRSDLPSVPNRREPTTQGIQSIRYARPNTVRCFMIRPGLHLLHRVGFLLERSSRLRAAERAKTVAINFASFEA